MIGIGAGVVLIGLAVAGWIEPWGYIGIIPLLTGLLRLRVLDKTDTVLHSS